MERESLSNLKLFGYTRRGDAHINGISKTYEARNYTSMISSMIASFVVLLTESPSCALTAITAVTLGMLSVLLPKRFTCGKRVGDIYVIQQGRIRIRGSSLFVDSVCVTGVANSSVTRELFLQQGLGVVITLKKKQFRVTLEDAGQRQIILYEVAGTLGVRTYQHIERSMERDKMMIVLVPVDRDTGRMIAAIRSTPVLGGSRRVRRIMSRQEPEKE